MELTAQLQSANETRKELEGCANNKAECIEELDAIQDRLERNEERVRNVYCVVLCCVVLCCVVLCCIVLYCIVLYCIVLYCIVLYCTVLYCIVLCCVVL